MLLPSRTKHTRAHSVHALTTRMGSQNDPHACLETKAPTWQGVMSGAACPQHNTSVLIPCLALTATPRTQETAMQPQMHACNC